MWHRMYKRVIILFVSLLLISSIVLIKCTQKKDINTATYKDLEKMQFIGDKLAKEITQFTKEHKVKTVDELDIKYLGEKRIKELKKYYK